MNDLSPVPQAAASFDRRGLFRLGGLTAATAALVAACGTTEAGEVGRVGDAPDVTALPEATFDNGVLLRTAASIELSVVAAYEKMLSTGNLDDVKDAVTAFSDTHTKAAETFNALAQEAGAEPWLCGNPRLDSSFINVILDRVENGAAATDAAQAITPSDDPARDMKNLIHALESLTAASCQALVPQVTEPSFRAEAMRIGVREARQSATMSLLMWPGAYVTGEEAAAAQPSAPTTTVAPTTTQNLAAPPATNSEGEPAPPQTEIVPTVAIPSQFGSLAPYTYIGGSGDENGVRLKLNVEPPSLNSFVYDYLSCEG